MSTATIRHFCPREGVIVVLREPLVVPSSSRLEWMRATLSGDLSAAWESSGDSAAHLRSLCGPNTYDLAGLRIHAPSEEAAIAAALEERWADLDDRVDAWHAGKGAGQTLPEFLGMTEAEYAEWSADPATLPLPEGWVCLPLTQCGGFEGPCDAVDGVDRAGVRTAYVDQEQPNPMLCPECRKGWHAYWDDLWSEVVGW